MTSMQHLHYFTLLYNSLIKKINTIDQKTKYVILNLTGILRKHARILTHPKTRCVHTYMKASIDTNIAYMCTQTYVYSRLTYMRTNNYCCHRHHKFTSVYEQDCLKWKKKIVCAKNPNRIIFISINIGLKFNFHMIGNNLR